METIVQKDRGKKEKWGGKGKEEEEEGEKGSERRKDREFQYIVPVPPVTVFNRKSALLVTRCAISRSLHRSSIFFRPPFPGCRMQLSMLYIRGTSIFSTYGHVHTFIRTYLFFVDTRRHCCELNATRYEIPRLQFALPRTRYIYTDLDPLWMFQFFQTFFSLSSKILFPLHTREKLSCDLLDRLGNSPLIKGYVLLTRRGLDTICNFKFSAASAPINGPTGRRGARFIVIKCQHDRRPAISSYLKFFQLRKLAAAYRGHLVGSLASGDHPLPSYFVSRPTFLSVYRGRQSSRSTRVTFRHSRI